MQFSPSARASRRELFNKAFMPARQVRRKVLNCWANLRGEPFEIRAGSMAFFLVFAPEERLFGRAELSSS